MTTKEAVFPLEKARKAAEELVLLLGPACRRIEIAGSLRRKMPVVHDIDLVVWAVYDDKQQPGLFGEVLTLRAGPDKLSLALRNINALPGDKIPLPVECKNVRFVWYGYPVDLYLCERDGANFEALLQMRTGPAGHNAWLASRAKIYRMYYKAGYGLFEAYQNGELGERADDGTEAGIYAALNLSWPAPQNC